MSQSISEVMTQKPVILDASSTAVQAAEMMREHDVGDVLVQDEGAICGIVTDRDLVVRCIAGGADPRSQTLGELCSKELAALEADSSVEDAVDLMRSRAIRRLPVMRGGKAVGIVSLGDLAQLRDPQSALGKISAAPASH